MSAAPTSPAATLGVIVPCRDEARVIARKLANLASLAWPADGRPHRLVVVDDGSRDDTAARARASIAQAFDGQALRAEVVENEVRAGKSGAIEQGLRALGDGVDLVLLSDADVVFEREALARVVEAFAADARLGMASGAQRFVRDLADDGRARAADGGEPVPAAGFYDRITARVRALESRGGRLFSVHGQLLAWRASLGLVPTPGFAADDLDLMVQARLGGARVGLVAGARFLEVKTPAGPAREAQELRRARAYVQFLRHPRLLELTAASRGLDRLQVLAYRFLPTTAPWWVPILAFMWVFTIPALVLPTRLALAWVLLFVALALSPVGRRLFALLRAIGRAKGRESVAPLSDRWETPRA